MRVVVVTHVGSGKVLKVFQDWDDADEWVENSTWSVGEINTTSAKVRHHSQ